jgi:hypothetical protein
MEYVKKLEHERWSLCKKRIYCYCFQRDEIFIQSWCSQLTKLARNIAIAVCGSPPEDDQVVLETCTDTYFLINRIKCASPWFHYTDILWCTVSKILRLLLLLLAVSCAFLGHYTVSSYDLLTSFLGDLSVPSSGDIQRGFHSSWHFPDNQCFWNGYNTAWPCRGEPSSDHAVPIASTYCVRELSYKLSGLVLGLKPNILLTAHTKLAFLEPVCVRKIKQECTTVCSLNRTRNGKETANDK